MPEPTMRGLVESLWYREARAGNDDTARALLAAKEALDAVARVRALPYEDEDKPNTHDELWAQGYNAGLRAAFRALDGTEAT